jgi:hypothetical protein
VRETDIDFLREDAIPIVNEEAVGMIGLPGIACSGYPAVGWAVTLWWRILRDPISMTTKTYRVRNVAVITTKKSQATMSLT